MSKPEAADPLMRGITPTELANTDEFWAGPEVFASIQPAIGQSISITVDGARREYRIAEYDDVDGWRCVAEGACGS